MRLTRHTKVRKEEFGTVVFDTLTEKIFVADQIGGQILEFVQQGRDLTAIVQCLAETYDGDPRTIEQDVRDFIECLRAGNMIETGP